MNSQNSFHVKPRKNYVVIEPSDEKPINTFLALPEELEAKTPPKGKVIAVGPQVAEVAVGDIVHYERFDWSVTPGDCIIIREEEILAKETHM